jgi:glycerophosphoryl diester phosphodiesterase
VILLDPDARPVIGHRGASGDFPENTLLAFRKAIEAGADALEFDVRLAGDGVPVVMHDPTVDRTTDGQGLVNGYSLVQLRKLDAGRGERIPTLDEAFEVAGSVPVILEIKETAVAAGVRKCIDSHAMRKNVLVGSFIHSALAPFPRDTYAVSASRRVATAFFAASRLGLVFPGGFKGFCLPEYHRSLRVLDRRFFETAKKAGKPVHVWTVNKLENARELWDLGATGMISNFPELMLGELGRGR